MTRTTSLALALFALFAVLATGGFSCGGVGEGEGEGGEGEGGEGEGGEGEGGTQLVDCFQSNVDGASCFITHGIYEADIAPANCVPTAAGLDACPPCDAGKDVGTCVSPD